MFVVVVSGEADDDFSSVAKSYYKLDLDKFQEYTEHFIASTLKYHIVNYFILDNAENWEEINNLKISRSSIYDKIRS